MKWYEIKEYFMFFFVIAGVVLFWAGVWDGLGKIWILKNPFVSLIVGIFLYFTISKIFKEADPFDRSGKKDQRALRGMVNHPRKHELTIHYRDHIKNKEIELSGKDLHRTERGFLVFKQDGKEHFVPFNRISKVKHKEKIHWKHE